MIIQLLQQTAQTLSINGAEPIFVFDARGMDNVVMDKVNGWSINIPFIDDEIRFDLFHERKYNLRIAFHIVSEIHQNAAFYQGKFDLLAAQQKAFLIALDKLKDDQGRRLLTVRGDVPIKSEYVTQTTAFNVPTTAIFFNLPLVLSQYESIC